MVVKEISDDATPSQEQVASLKARVFALVRACPVGRVTTYGWDPTRDLSEEELKHILDDAAHIPVNASERLLYLMRNDPASPLRGTEVAK